MKILLQRVSSASVEIAEETVGRIGAGVLLLVGFTHSDTAINYRQVVEKVSGLRIFPDGQGRLNHSLTDVGGGALLVPQFTLYASTNRGRRPDFTHAMRPDLARQCFESCLGCFTDSDIVHVASGRFGADMQVHLVNDGPLTLELEFKSGS